jgi:hypothetical protein
LERAVIRRQNAWTQERELLASILEMLHMIYLLTARANGAKNVGKPMRVPRPGDKPKAPLSPREFALQLMR